MAEEIKNWRVVDGVALVAPNGERFYSARIEGTEEIERGAQVARVLHRGGVPASEWQWLGMPGHLIVSSRCCFHLHTIIGDYRVSTIGCYHPKGCGEGKIEAIGADHLYETMVFSADLEDFTGKDFDGYQTEDEANGGHQRMCERYAQDQA